MNDKTTNQNATLGDNVQSQLNAAAEKAQAEMSALADKVEAQLNDTAKKTIGTASSTLDRAKEYCGDAKKKLNQVSATPEKADADETPLPDTLASLSDGMNSGKE